LKRRILLQLSTASAVNASLPHARAQDKAMASFSLEEKTIDELAALLRQGKSTSQSITQQYLDRIEAIDRRGPKLNSLIELNPDALAIAAERDAELKVGTNRGPLHGLPIVIKDNIATADKMQTTAGSMALINAKALRDAFLVQRLRKAGAVVLAKSNLSEWANFRGQRSTSGWSTRAGQTLNPYALNRSPSGSSSGTGAAVAANLCVAGIGTETDGSITSPSSVAALVGMKPTVGLVSRSGVIPIAFSQDTAGPMCRTVVDAAVLLAAIAGVDASDSSTNGQSNQIDIASLTRLSKAALKGTRLGVARNLMGYHNQVDALFEEAVRALKEAGAQMLEAPIPNTEKYQNAELDVLLFEMRHGMALYLKEFASNLPHRTLADLIAFNKANPEALKLFGQEWFEKSEAIGPLTKASYKKALETCRRYARTDGIDAALRKQRLNALIAPTGGPAWLIDPINGDASGGSATSPAAVAGYPHITVPMGQVSGLPVGLSFMGTAWADAMLLNYAFAFEQATKLRKSPTFVTTV
jgi:amidase